MGNGFMFVFIIILGVVFLIFLVYEGLCLARDIKKRINKKKESKLDTKENKDNK